MDDLGLGSRVVAGGGRQRLHLLHQLALAGGGRIGLGRHDLVGAAHHGLEATGVGVELEQRLGQLRLHAQQVDQETQRADVGGEAAHGLLGRRAHGGVIVCTLARLREDGVDLVAHAHDGLASLVQAQHRQHAAHGRQLGRHGHQQLALGRIAVELVQLALDVGERGAQLLHHAAHRLAIGGTAIEVFHPRLDRPGRAALARQVDALGELVDAGAERGVGDVGVVERGVQAQQAGGDFHRQARRRHGRAVGHLGDGGVERARHVLALGMELAHRIGHQRGLFAQAGREAGLAGGGGRPRFLQRLDTAARQRDERRVVAAERFLFVVDGFLRPERERLAHGLEARRLGVVARQRAGAEEQQVLREPVGDLGLAAFGQAHLRQQARREALAVDVGRQAALRLRLEERGGHGPQARQLAAGARGEAGEQLAHLRGGRAHRATQQREHALLHAATGIGVGLERHDMRAGRSLHERRRGIGQQCALRLRVGLPEVGRVDAIRARERLHFAVLREQGERRDVLAGQAAAQEIEQGERRAFDGRRGGAVELAHLLREADHGLLAGAQHAGAFGLADHVERTGALMEQRAGLLQGRGGGAVDLRALRRGLGLADLAPQRLVRVVQGTAKLVGHPGQRAQICRHCVRYLFTQRHLQRARPDGATRKGYSTVHEGNSRWIRRS